MTIRESSVMMVNFGQVDLPKYCASRGGLHMFDCSKSALEFWDGVLETTHCEMQVLNLLSNCFDSKTLVNINHEHLLSNGVGINADNLLGCGEGIIVVSFECLINGLLL